MSALAAQLALPLGAAPPEPGGNLQVAAGVRRVRCGCRSRSDRFETA